MRVSVELKGYNRVRNDLRALASANRTIIDPVMREFAKTQRARLKARPYPAPPVGSTYIRTGRLANSFRVETRGQGEYAVTNSAPYASYVVGPTDKKGTDGGQAWMHRGRWWTMVEVVKEDLPKLRRDIEQAIKDLWTRGA